MTGQNHFGCTTRSLLQANESMRYCSFTTTYIAGILMDWGNVVGFLNQGWVSIAVTAVIAVPSLYFTLRKTDPRPAYQTSGQRLITSGGGILPNEVTVEYDGVPVTHVSITLVAFWNNGKSTIRGSDIHQNYPIGFGFNDGRILTAEIIKCSRMELEATTEIDPNDDKKLLMNFSFLDKNDGFIVKILHTSKKITPSYFGTIIGIPKGAQNFGQIALPTLLSRKKRLSSVVSRIVSTPSWTTIILFSATGIMLSFSSLYYVEFKKALSSLPDSDPILRGMLAIVGGLYLGGATQIWWRLRRRVPSSMNIYEL